jgi:hypothetical protein
LQDGGCGYRAPAPMKLYIINLERARDRRAFMEKQVVRLDHEFIEAVDLRTLKREDWPQELSLGAAAAGLSHQKAWRAIVRDGRTGIVLEDDAILPRELPEIPLEEGVALLLYRHPPTLAQCRLRGPGPLLEPLDRVLCGTAYAITPEAAATLIEFDPPAHGLGPDFWAHFPVKVWCVEGRPVGHKNSFPSTLGYRDGRLIPNWLRTLNRKRIERTMSNFVRVD